MQNKFTQQLITFIACAMLLSQGAFGSIVTAFNLSAAQSFAKASGINSDAMLICTGSQTKWISESIYFETGDIVELTASDGLTDLPTSIHSVDCSFDPVVEPSLELFSFEVLQHQWLAYKALIQTLLQRPYTAFPYTQSLSRAPPASVFI